ncbi:hypothetical protein H9Q69_002101 [Fusarium xylarioides]|uniref:Uncharacterized protein n=1 Tax=Fusarium xylarioides TaxID=221167 RepID=A0A9P7I8E9_9HYPO|nr:hypothetical protein H9Q70_003920 [Fusarium xylarioides]KAG5770633.1 hypothetical protein H9Q72_002540 [Fusarium xylarioides]KAG5782646.1 hypothetical protein H9Q73_003712 [Fusarium xylarioides]KAG5798869.1 hypothetical protein H9Q69_002101 [Fusarium xylarioides]KAG5816602.1 hypothetical protein H9Q71_002277 [Fusarium xylarioides]
MEDAQVEPEERQRHYSQEEIDRLEGELSPIDALATFMRPGVIIPYPRGCHPTNCSHLHGSDQKTRRISETNAYKKLELIGEDTIVDLVKAPLSDLDRQIRGVRIRTDLEQRIARAFNEHNFQYGFKIKAPVNIQFFADWKRFCQDHQESPSPGTTVDKLHPLPQIVRRALINEDHPRGRKPMDPVVTEELLRRGDNLECMPPLHLFDTQPCIEEFSLKDLRVTRYMMEDAGIDTEKIAALMGEAFAILHFKCEALGHACFALGASPAYEAWKFGPLEIGIHIL